MAQPLANPDEVVQNVVGIVARFEETAALAQQRQKEALDRLLKEAEEGKQSQLRQFISGLFARNKK